MTLIRRGFAASILAATILVPAVSFAQAPPRPETPIAPKTEQLDPNTCAPGSARATVGEGGEIEVKKPEGANLSNQLARSQGVICPPAHVDPEIKAPTPPGGPMPVIPPPGTPGGDPGIQPK